MSSCSRQGAQHGEFSNEWGKQYHDPNLDPELFLNEDLDVGLLSNGFNDVPSMFPNPSQAEVEPALKQEDEPAIEVPLNFDSFEGYRGFVDQERLQEYNKAIAKGRPDDAPTTPPGKQEYIRKIIAAFKNTDNIIDKESKRGNIAQAAQRLKEDYYSTLEFEKAAWELFETARLAQVGVKLTTQRPGVKFETYPTFKDRIEAIIHGLTRSKAMCKQVLDPLYNNRICEHPAAELRSKIVNFKINGTRDVQNDIGRAGINGKLDVASLDTYKEQAQKKLEALVEKSKAVAELGTGAPQGTKRKHNAASSELEESAADESGEVATAGPRPRRHASSSRRATRSRTGAAQSNAQSQMQAPSAPAHWQSLPPNNLQSSRRQHHSHPHPQLTHSPPRAPSTPTSPEHAHRLTLCTILSLPASFASTYNLTELRMYARAYNTSLSASDWFIPNHPEYTGRGTQITRHDGHIYTHLALPFPRLRVIALERRDLLPSLEVNPVGRFRAGFTVGESEEVESALGVRRVGGRVYDAAFMDPSGYPPYASAGLSGGRGGRS